MNSPARRPLQPGEVNEPVDLIALDVTHHCGGRVGPVTVIGKPLPDEAVGCERCSSIWKLSTLKGFSAAELARRFSVLDDDAEIERTRPRRLVWHWADEARSAYTLALVSGLLGLPPMGEPFEL
jgi:hypothetical protein